MQNEADIRVFNPSKEISREITLEILIRHRDAMKQARTGDRIGVEEQPTNARKMNQVRALNLIISAQREMITVSRPIIYFRSMQKWKKSQKSVKDETPVTFEKHKNDYNDMLYLLSILKACELDIIEAERTKMIEDDFVIEKMDDNGETKFELTKNFFGMLEELETSYEKIYLLMLVNKIVSAGIEEDEESSYKEKEAEMVKRVGEA